MYVTTARQKSKTVNMTTVMKMWKEKSLCMSNGDSVFNYACEVMTLGLLWNCYHDAIQEGDGDRVMLIWKFLLLVFKASHQKKYSVEAAVLFLQHQYFLSPRMAG